jgi:hypothetical protein
MATLSDALELSYEPHKYDCSGFVKAAVNGLEDAALELPAEDDADALIDYWSKNWVAVDGGLAAANLAASGSLVVAGVQSGEYSPKRDMGHVVIIAPLTKNGPITADDLYHGLYPLAWGGDIGRAYMSKGTLSVGEIFNKSVRDKVRYFTPPTAAK